ncbi:MAG: hypothetical protein ACK5KL_04230 [Dysgonomonas sp.]
MDTNFSITDLFKYWDTLTQYINPVTIILWGIIGGIVGFALFVIVEAILRKRILIRRRHWSLKYLAYAYMVFFPLLGGFCFSQWFALHRCQQELVKNIPTYLGDANSAFNTYLKDEVIKIIDARHLQLSGHEIIDKAATVAGSTVSTQLREISAANDTTLTAKASSYLLSKAAETEVVKNMAVSYVEKKLGETVMMDENMTNDVLNVKVENILEDGVLNTLLEKYIKNIFGGLKMNVVLILLIGLAIPAAEIILAHFLEKKRLKAEAAIISTPVTPPAPSVQATEEDNQQPE